MAMTGANKPINYFRRKIMINQQEILAKLQYSLPFLKQYHSPNCKVYDFLNSVSKIAVTNLFGEHGPQKVNLNYLGVIEFPFVSFGKINSTHLFGLDELIIFSFYWINKNRYNKVCDLGANVGLHSIILSNLGYNVTAYEPDNFHFSQLQKNIEKNCSLNLPTLINKAVSINSGELEFIRILGNTTGSHIAGSKENIYGDFNRFIVPTDSFLSIVNLFDLLKIDVEGHEADILLCTTRENWLSTDAIVEVGSQKNAQKILEHFNSMGGVNLFSQKNFWNRVYTLNDMPFSYKDGSLFISTKDEMPW
jgi:FkbM family methyltransferase